MVDVVDGGTPRLFNDIARGYDRWSLILSAAGIHFWHQAALEDLDLGPGQTVLDVGCGTGTETRMLAARLGHTGRVTGVDPAREMLEVARTVSSSDPGNGAAIEWVEDGAESLPFADQTFDRVTAQFSIRNMQNWRDGLKHMIRVLKPQGRLVILEMVQPVTTEGSVAWQSLNKVTQTLPAFSGLSQYRWLAESLWHAPTAHELIAAARECGVKLEVTHSWLGGLVVVLGGSRRAENSSLERAPVAIWASDGSMTALQGGRWLAKYLPSQCTVHVVTVIPDRPIDRKIRNTDTEAWYNAQKQAMKDVVINPEKLVPIVLNGSPAKQIVSYAKRTAATLIVLGHKRRDPYAERVAGGVTQYILDHAPCPVLTIGLPIRDDES